MEKKKFITKFRIKLSILTGIFLLCYLVYLNYGLISEKIPIFNAIFLFIQTNLVNKSITGMFLSSILGSLFFIFLPIEMQFSYYYFSQYHWLIVVSILFIGNIIGLSLDYLIGYVLGEKIARKIFKDKYDKLIKFNKVTGILVFIGNIIFFPIEIFSFIAGSIRYDYKKFIILTAIGKLIKFGIMAYLMIQFGTALELSMFLP